MTIIFSLVVRAGASVVSAGGQVQSSGSLEKESFESIYKLFLL